MFCFLFITTFVFLRRCANADPNYGSAWFECREQPFDVPSSVVDSAARRMARDVAKAERVYARAIMHFVCRCAASDCAAEAASGERFTSRDSAFVSPVKSSKGATQFATPVRDGKESELRRLRQRASHSSGASSVLTRMKEQEDSLRRHRELCADAAQAQVAAADTAGSRGGFSVSDFVTGLVDMNRGAFGPDRLLSADARRKSLYGADHILA